MKAMCPASRYGHMLGQVSNPDTRLRERGFHMGILSSDSYIAMCSTSKKKNCSIIQVLIYYITIGMQSCNVPLYSRSGWIYAGINIACEVDEGECTRRIKK